MSIKYIEFVSTNLPRKKTPGTDSLTGDFSQTVKEELLFYTNSSRKLKRSEYFPGLLNEASITLIPKLDKKQKRNHRQVSPTTIDARISKILRGIYKSNITK